MSASVCVCVCARARACVYVVDLIRFEKSKIYSNKIRFSEQSESQRNF